MTHPTSPRRRTYTPQTAPEPVTTDEDADVVRQIAECERRLAELRARQTRPRTTTTTTTTAASDEVETGHLSTLEPAEYSRYGRQLVMPEIGLEGQTRLKRTSILIVGAGGLGCPAAAYLAGAGVGTIGIVDGDTVEESNLHRQILHSTSKTGWTKLESAISSLRGINPNVVYRGHGCFLSPSNACEIISGYDIVLDCTDNPASRYLISDVCVQECKPLVSASALKTEGQLVVLNFPPRPAGYVSKGGVSTTTTTTTTATTTPAPDPDQPGPCYRCIFPRPPPAETVLSCGDGGILGPVVGTLGVLQALEAIKVAISPLLDDDTQDDAQHDDDTRPRNLVGHAPSMLVFSAFTSPQFRTVRLRGRRPGCAACSAGATISATSIGSDPEGYVVGCGGASGQAADGTGLEVAHVSPTEVYHSLSSPTSPVGGGQSKPTMVVVDVREEVQYQLCRLVDAAGCVPYAKLARARPDDWVRLRQTLGRVSRVDGGDGVSSPDPDQKSEPNLPPVLDHVRSILLNHVDTLSKPDRPNTSVNDTDAITSTNNNSHGAGEVELPVVCVCRRGIDSKAAARLLDRELGGLVLTGHDGNVRATISVRDMAGGLVRWRRDVDPAFPSY